MGRWVTAAGIPAAMVLHIFTAILKMVVLKRYVVCSLIFLCTLCAYVHALESKMALVITRCVDYTTATYNL